MAKLATTSKGARRRARTAGDIERLLRRYYDVGKKSPKDSDGKPTNSKHDTKYQKAHLRDCCRFAAACTRSELKALLKLRSQQGTPLSWSVVRLLMTVKNKEKRKKLLALASWCAGSSIKRPCQLVPATLAPAAHHPDAKRRVHRCAARLPARPRPAPLVATNSSPGVCSVPIPPSRCISPPVCSRSITPPVAVAGSRGCTLAAENPQLQ
jgi:hypothetical protein